MVSLSKQPNGKYTFKDYLNWPDEERWELIDGVPVMQASPLRIHQKVCGELFYRIRGFLEGKPCEIYTAPFCVRLPREGENDEDATTVVEPDLTIVCSPDKLDQKGCKGAPDMIIEIISPNSVKNDRLLKFNLYERAGVWEYWIVEPEEKLVSVFRLNEQNRYGRPEVYDEENLIKVGILKDLEVNLKDIFNY